MQKKPSKFTKEMQLAKNRKIRHFVASVIYKYIRTQLELFKFLISIHNNLIIYSIFTDLFAWSSFFAHTKQIFRLYLRSQVKLGPKKNCFRIVDGCLLGPISYSPRRLYLRFQLNPDSKETCFGIWYHGYPGNKVRD